MKEFLSQVNQEVEYINILQNPEGMKELLSLGLRTVPVVAIDDNYVHALNLEDVAEFIGHYIEKRIKLPPEELIEKLDFILAATKRYYNQIPWDKENDQIVEGRDRVVKHLIYHIFNLGELFVETCNGKEFTYDSQYNEIPETMTTKRQIIEYGDEVRDLIKSWWNEYKGTYEDQVDTYYGKQSLHEFLERITWHIAQHVRQVINFLIRNGIKPEKPLTEEDLAGLPIPKNITDK